MDKSLDELIAEHITQQAAEATRLAGQEFTKNLRALVREEVARIANDAGYYADGCVADALYKLASEASA